MVGDLAAGLAARVEAGEPVRPLAVEGEEAEALALPLRGLAAAGPDPRLEHLLGESEEPPCLGRRLARGGRRVDLAIDVGDRPHAMFLARSASRPSETFSCTPTARGERPSATPRSWVK